MSKKFNLKATARIQSTNNSSVDLLSFNQLILKNEADSTLKKFHLDRIYHSSDTNQKLFENILRVPTNLLFEGLSSMVFCLGSPNSGKTYTLAGKMKYSNEQLAQPGIVTYLMRRLFSKFKHEASLYSTYSVWCKVLSIERDEVIDMTNNLKKTHGNHAKFKDLIIKNGSYLSIPNKGGHKYHTLNNSSAEYSRSSINNGEKIQIKNYSHFEQIIQAVYKNNSNKRHTIVELILQKQLASGKSSMASITFVEFGSFFYNCPFREAQELEMQNQIESVLTLLQNLSRSNIEDQKQLFEGSYLTKILKQNFLKCTEFEVMGLLDDSYQNNLKTMNFLDMLMQRRHETKITQNVKEEIKREEIFLKNLYDKHRRVLNILSRCIGMQLGSLQKKKKNRNFDGPIMNSFYKTCEKIKYANQKKLQNQKILDEIRKEIEKEDNQLCGIEQQYEQKFQKLDQQKEILKNKKKQLKATYESIIAPPIKYNNTDCSLYWRPEQISNKIMGSVNNYNNGNNGVINHQIDSQQAHLSIDSDRDSKQDQNNRPLKIQDTNTLLSIDYNQKDNGHRKKNGRRNFRKNTKNYDRYQRKQNFISNVIESRVDEQLKKEIGKLFKLILQKQQRIQKQNKIMQSDGNMSCNMLLMNKIKNRSDFAKFNKEIALKCFSSLLQSSVLKENGSNYSVQPIDQFQSHGRKELQADIKKDSKSNYCEFIKNFEIQTKIEKDIEIKNNTSSMNAISMRSLATEKNIGN